MTLLTGISGCTRDINRHLRHAAPGRYSAALTGASVAFALQWHPEWGCALVANSVMLFHACRAYRRRDQEGGMSVDPGWGGQGGV